jgi:ATP-dependent DNA ligase
LELEQSGQWCAEPKCDGIWCSVQLGSDRKVTILSRSGQDKTSLVAALADTIARSAVPADTILLGELGCWTPAAEAEIKRVGHGFVDVFDVLRYGGDDASTIPYRSRRSVLELLVITGPAFRPIREWVRLVPCWNTAFARHYAQADEGLMLKRLDSLPGVGMLKVKKRLTVDYVVMDWARSTAASKAAELMAATVICGAYVQGRLRPLVRVPIGTLAWCREFAQHFEHYRGTVMEIACSKQFKSGSLRHPSFVRVRHDKAAAECVYTPAA